VLECPYFESSVAVFEEPNESGHHSGIKSEERPAILCLGDVASPSVAQSSSSKNDQDFIGRAPENFSEETHSPSSGKSVSQEMKVIVDIVIAKIPHIHLSVIYLIFLCFIWLEIFEEKDLDFSF
jgi:hypothetical protein